MSKIVPFRNKNEEDIVSFLEMILEDAKEGKFDNIMVASILKDDNIATGYFNLDYGDRQTLSGHQQVDIMCTAVEENYL